MSNESRPPNPKSPLHNFSFPPTFPKWGNQRLLRCLKSPSSSSSSSPRSHLIRTSVVKSESSVVESDDRDTDFQGSSSVARPWNLRTRRAAPPPSGGSGVRGEKMDSPNGGGLKKSEKRLGFSVALSKEEVEFDFLRMMGARPPRRPKKRPRILQKQVDLVFPGFWLTEITADRYKVSELPEPLKG